MYNFTPDSAVALSNLIRLVMKKSLYFVVPLLMAVSCSDVQPEADPFGEGVWEVDPNLKYVRAELSASERKVGTKGLDFGIEIFKDIVREEGLSEDALVSPLGASLCLSMASSAAQGETYNQFARGLGFEGMDSKDVMSYYKKVTDCILSAGGTARTAIANALWSSFEPKASFVQDLEYYYNAEVSRLDFTKAEATKVINEWTSERTHGMIPKLFDSKLSSSTQFVMENVVYFNCPWTVEKYATTKSRFNNVRGKSVSCTFFGARNAMLFSYFGDDVSMIMLPYKGDAFNMVFILPEKEKQIDRFVQTISGDVWNGWFNQIDRNEVTFSIPCFESTFTAKESFENAIKNRGITLAFSNDADFGRMSDQSLSLTAAIQKTAIKVSETGTEAAAATAVMGDLTDDDPDIKHYDFTADRPFLYAIVEKSTGAILFMGAHVK